MASAAAFSATSCSTNMRIRFFNTDLYTKQQKQTFNVRKIRASANDQEDCNVEECAPDKEVGKVSMEWLAGEKTKVAGTFPPRRRDWSGYVEKDTAGQTNIYSVEPAVYVAESAISSGTSGTSADGAENTAAVFGFGGLIAVAAASVVLLQVGKNAPPQIKTLDYSGPSLSYYITKFKPLEVVQTQPISSQEAPSPDTTTVTSTETPAVDIPQALTETAIVTPEASTDTVVVTPQLSIETTPQLSTETAISTPQALEVVVEVGSE
ncbi:hypothetical protein LXL04_034218 [Taraxacum kok-saghyz]